MLWRWKQKSPSSYLLLWTTRVDKDGPSVRRFYSSPIMSISWWRLRPFNFTTILLILKEYYYRYSMHTVINTVTYTPLPWKVCLSIFGDYCHPVHHLLCSEKTVIRFLKTWPANGCVQRCFSLLLVKIIHANQFSVSISSCLNRLNRLHLLLTQYVKTTLQLPNICSPLRPAYNFSRTPHSP